MNYKFLLLVASVILITQSCRKPAVPDPNPETGENIEQLNIPHDFNFSTTKEITLTISDDDNKVSYDVYTMTTNVEPEVFYVGEDTLINIDNSNQLIASGF
ncbi:MAG: hypothetical protein JEZ03_13640, partial [Bacteroidales bacterium]|nr:hypothetical protein [Bacteroidales bacterium]